MELFMFIRLDMIDTICVGLLCVYKGLWDGLIRVASFIEPINYFLDRTSLT